MIHHLDACLTVFPLDRRLSLCMPGLVPQCLYIFPLMSPTCFTVIKMKRSGSGASRGRTRRGSQSTRRSKRQKSRNVNKSQSKTPFICRYPGSLPRSERHAFPSHPRGGKLPEWVQQFSLPIHAITEVLNECSKKLITPAAFFSDQTRPLLYHSDDYSTISSLQKRQRKIALETFETASFEASKRVN